MPSDPPQQRPAGLDFREVLPPPDPRLLRRPAGGAGGSAGRGGRGPGRDGRGGGGRRGRRSWGQRILLGFLVLATLAAGAASALVAYGLDKIERIERVEVALSELPPPGEPRNFLLVGSDNRSALEGTDLNPDAFMGEGAEGSGQRSDTIMVVRIDPAAESVDVLSLPRDLWLPIAGTGRSQRINTAYAGGPQQLVDTVETNLDIPVHHYVEVDFAGFAGLVSAIGGVPMWFDTPVRDTHSGLYIDNPGCVILDAQMALAFARSRHYQYRTERGWQTDGTGDLGRITRQQVFLRKAIDQVRGLGLGDVLTFNRLVDVGVGSVTLDDSIGLGQLADLGRRFTSFTGEALRTYSVPVTPFLTSGGADVLRLRLAESQPILNIFRGLPVGTLHPVQVQDVTVLNGTGAEGQAGLVADALRQIGFGVAAVGDVDAQLGQLARTTIRYAPGAEAAADLVERHLTAGAELVEDPELADGEVVLMTGLDLTTIGRNARPAPTTTSTSTSTSTTGTTGTTSAGTSSVPTTAADGAAGAASGGLATGSPTTVTTTSSAPPSSDPIGVAPDPAATCG